MKEKLRELLKDYSYEEIVQAIKIIEGKKNNGK